MYMYKARFELFKYSKLFKYKKKMFPKYFTMIQIKFNEIPNTISYLHCKLDLIVNKEFHKMSLRSFKIQQTFRYTSEIKSGVNFAFRRETNLHFTYSLKAKIMQIR